MSSSNGHTNLSGMPADIASETGLLSCIAQDNLTVFPLVEREGVRSPWFDDLRNQRWFNFFRDMTKAGELADSVTIASRFRDPIYDCLGGLPSYAELLTLAPSPSNWSYYIPPLRRCYVRRTTIRACLEAIALAKDETQSHDNLLADLNASVQGIWPPRNALPEVESGLDIYNSMLPDSPELVVGRINQGTTVSLGGGSKTCKTWVLMDLALSVASGTPWLGCETKKAKVLFVNMELLPNSFSRRLKKICKEKEIQEESLGNVDVWNLRDFTAPYHQLIPRIMEQAKLQGYALIILDPIYMMYGDLKENDSGDISKLMTEIGKLRRESGATIAFAAHFSKGNQAEKEVLDRISGSGVFSRNPDSIFTLTPLATEGYFAFDSVLRDLAPAKPFAVRWDYPIMRREDKADPSDLKKPGGRTKTTDPSKIAALLSEKNLTTKQWYKLASEEMGVARATFYRAIQDLKASNNIIKTQTGEWSLNLKLQPPVVAEGYDTKE